MVGRQGNTSVLLSTRGETASAMRERAVATLGRALADVEAIVAVTEWGPAEIPEADNAGNKEHRFAVWAVKPRLVMTMNTAARTLIFGGTGFIGGHVPRRLRDHGA